MSWDDRVMWALVAVGLVGRQLGLPVTEALAEADGAGMLTLAELRRGCLSGQDDLRLSSLLLLVSTAKSVKPLEAVELRLLLEVCLPACLLVCGWCCRLLSCVDADAAGHRAHASPKALYVLKSFSNYQP